MIARGCQRSGYATVIVPVTLGFIFLILYLNFRRLSDTLIVVGTLPLAAVGSVWFLWLLDYDLSVAVGVGFIAMAGVAAEIGVVLLVFLNAVAARHERENRPRSRADLDDTVHEGASLRVRPILMTTTTTVVALLPIMLGSGTGSETMRRIAAPMVGGTVSAVLLTLVVIPVIFALVRGSGLSEGRRDSMGDDR